MKSWAFIKDHCYYFANTDDGSVLKYVGKIKCQGQDQAEGHHDLGAELCQQPTQGSNSQPWIAVQTQPTSHRASLPWATKPASFCRDLPATCPSSQFIPVSFPLISPWGLIDGDRRQSIAVWQNVYYQPSRKWLLRGNFEPPDYDAVSHILNCSKQCIKVLQGDLVFHSLLGKERTGANWFQGKASTEDSKSLHPSLWKEHRIKHQIYMAKGNAHFIPLDCSKGDSTASATEAPDTVIHTTKASGPYYSCLWKLVGFLPTLPQPLPITNCLGCFLLHKSLFYMNVSKMLAI